MNYLEVRFDYGAWSVEITRKGAVGRAISEWLVVALWRAFKRCYLLPQPQNGER